MSVFRLKEWWSVSCGEEGSEEFDTGSLVVGNLDNASHASNKIAVGSLSGKLRVYSPTRPQFRVEDLLIEEYLGAPILQILVGLFLPASSTTLGLAVLFPRKLAVYELQGHGGSYYTLQKSYEHDLGIDGKHFTAMNMSAGPFGGVKSRDMIIVQSMDGKLQIFEQTAHTFTRQLVDCLLPGPVQYLPRLDAFVIANYAGQAECYRYQVLASSQAELGGESLLAGTGSAEGTGSSSRSGSGGSGMTTGAFGLTAVRGALVEWTTNLGDSCRQILEGSFSGTVSQQYNQRGGASGGGGWERSPSGELLMLCDRSMFLLKDSGGVVQQRLLERTPSCVCSYRPNGSGSTHNILLASHDGTLQVYCEFNLSWAARLPRAAIDMTVATFGGQNGLIVTLDDVGRLSLSYLGTKPPLNLTSSNPARELDYNKIDEEHRQLLQVIRESLVEKKVEPREKLLMRVQVPRALDTAPPMFEAADFTLPPDLVTLPGFLPHESGHVKVCVTLYISFAGKENAQNVSLAISAPGFMHVLPSNVLLKSVTAGAAPVTVKMYLYASKLQLPSSLEAEVVATYLLSNGEPRVASHAFSLPLFLACRPRSASKSATYKMTLDTTSSALPLTDLFDDFLFAAQEVGLDTSEILGATAAQAMGFQLWCPEFAQLSNTNGQQQQPNPAHVSILVSKTGGRYRVQSDCLPALTIISKELERRLVLQLTAQGAGGARSSDGSGDDACLVTCSDVFPVDELTQAISRHFNTRLMLRDLYSRLNDQAHLFRVLQKRLLTRFKDRNPTPLGGLEDMMRETYASVLVLADEAQSQQASLRRQTCDLNLLASLMVQLTALRLQLRPSSRKLLEAYFCPDLTDSGSGWEETVDASLTYLLKTSLAKNPKESASLTSSSLEMPLSIEPLIMHLQMVLDRLSNGVELA